MNERIKKLAKQAGFGLHRDGEIYASRLEHLPITEDIEKFAELIVKECLDCIAKVHKTEYTKEFNEGYTLGVERCFYKIEDHFFGVEE